MLNDHIVIKSENDQYISFDPKNINKIVGIYNFTTFHLQKDIHELIKDFDWGIEIKGNKVSLERVVEYYAKNIKQKGKA